MRPQPITLAFLTHKAVFNPTDTVQDEQKVGPGKVSLYLALAAFTILGCDLLHHLVG